MKRSIELSGKSLSTLTNYARYLATMTLHFNLQPEIYKLLFQKKWVMYCKQPFLAPNKSSNTSTDILLKIAISNHRLIDTSDGKATFMAKDYRRGGKRHPVSRKDSEFIRRFSFHILPKGFTRIVNMRYFQVH
ncbi:MAG: transposase [Labilibaculum sp.]|nr:transposase [Labilibaculum sp.]